MYVATTLSLTRLGDWMSCQNRIARKGHLLAVSLLVAGLSFV